MIRKRDFNQLTLDQQITLRNRMLAGDSDARRKLIESIIPFALSLAPQRVNRFVDHASSESVCLLAAVYAVDEWEPEKGALTTILWLIVRREWYRAFSKLIRHSGQWLDFANLDRLPGRDRRAEADAALDVKLMLDRTTTQQREILERWSTGETFDAIAKHMRLSASHTKRLAYRAQRSLESAFRAPVSLEGVVS